MLVQDTCVLLTTTISCGSKYHEVKMDLLDTDGRFDGLYTSGSGNKVGIEVGDTTQTVATESEGIGESSDSVLSSVEGVLSMMRVDGLGIWDYHLCDRQSIEERSSSLDSIIISDVRQNETFSKGGVS